MSLTESMVNESLKKLIDPNTEKSLVDTKSIESIDIVDEKPNLKICLGYPAKNYAETLNHMIIDKLLADGISCGTVEITWKIDSHSVQKSLQPMKNIKNVIAVASGKGGVGKSTTAVNIALALAGEGSNVGILDADIYGPSIPRMLGLSGQPDSQDGKSLEPMENHGLQAMSIGFLIDEETPMIWRGPMVTQALEQLLTDTQWRELDYLIIDLPPGTGDVQLTLAQKIPVSGSIIVTTPQNIALLDARKGLKMFEKVEVPVLGIVENMSLHICSKCGNEESIFGAGGGTSLAEESKVDLLGQLPLDKAIREQTDPGKPSVVFDPSSRIAEIYAEIARKAAGKLAAQAKDYSAKFPKIVIDNN